MKRVKLSMCDISGSVNSRNGKYAGVRAMGALLLWCIGIVVQPLPQCVQAGLPEDFVKIPAGTFWMGSPESESGRQRNETLHQVSVGQFYLCRHEVTVGEFRMFIEATGYQTEAEEKGDMFNWRHGPDDRVRGELELNHPVVHVSWNDAIAYCVWRTAKEKRLYWLPTEAQWEYACRAGTETPFSTGWNIGTDEANYDGENPYENNQQGVSRGTTTPVCSYSPNDWGVFDMHGNVWEWCSDWYGERYYDTCSVKGTVRDPQGSQGGSERILRGGGWYNFAQYCRSATRASAPPVGRSYHMGFRLVYIP